MLRLGAVEVEAFVSGGRYTVELLILFFTISLFLAILVCFLGIGRESEASSMPQKKNFVKRSVEEEEEGDQNNASADEEERRLVLEEEKFLQKQRERKSGMPAINPTVQTGAAVVAKGTDKVEADGEKEELVLQDTFA